MNCPFRGKHEPSAMTVIEHLNEPESKHVLGRENSGWETTDVQTRERLLSSGVGQPSALLARQKNSIMVTKKGSN
jgi:hypothetical protein